jgi:hypothetical protein
MKFIRLLSTNLQTDIYHTYFSSSYSLQRFAIRSWLPDFNWCNILERTETLKIVNTLSKSFSWVCSFMSIVGVRFRPWTRSVCLWLQRFLLLCQKVMFPTQTDAFTKLSKMKRPCCKSAGMHIFFSLKYHATHHLQKLPQNQWWWQPTYMAGSTALVLCQQLTAAPGKIQDPTHLKFAWNWMRRLCCHWPDTNPQQ